MDHNPDRLCVWPELSDMKRSRRAGRRVPKDASVLKPDLEGCSTAARAVGLRKIKRRTHLSPTSTPRPTRSFVGVVLQCEAIGAGGKEELLQLIGGQWREMQRNQRQAVAQETAPFGPKPATAVLVLNAKTRNNEAASRSARASKTADCQNRN